GLVIRSGGCLDGTETVAIVLNRKFKWQVGQTVLVFNVIIYTIAGIIFGWDRAMFSLLAYFIASKVIDMVETGFDKAKAAMIITDESEEISKLIYEKLGRTVTILEGEGLISGKKVILYCVLNKFEINELRSIINSVDTSAFIAISDVEEIIGTHIKKGGKLEEEKTKKEE
ncbi:MAG: YitT family protein, partial [Lachnospiraceae bacterium]|nr:YitT family protein [Lachnospiraceae bacterium]